LRQHLQAKIEGKQCKFEAMPIDSLLEPIAAANFERVVGVSPGRITKHFNETGGFLGDQRDVQGIATIALSPDDIHEWSKIYRGSDLFRGGIPRFAILAAVNDIHARRRRTTLRQSMLFSIINNNPIEHIKGKVLIRVVQQIGGGECRSKIEAIAKLMRCFKVSACRNQETICKDCQHLSALSVVCQVKEEDLMEELAGTDPLLLRRMVGDPGGWLVSPSSVQAHGAFPEALCASLDYDVYCDRLGLLQRLLRAPNESPPRRHLLRYRTFWNNDKHAESLDELVIALRGVQLYPAKRDRYWPVDGEEMQPPQLLNVLRGLRTLRDVRFSDTCIQYLRY
jgi:hypothetical protein